MPQRASQGDNLPLHFVFRVPDILRILKPRWNSVDLRLGSQAEAGLGYGRAVSEKLRMKARALTLS